MHKLENPQNAPLAGVRLIIESVGSSPSVVVSTDGYRRPPQVDGGQWTDDPSRLKQIVEWTGADGQCSVSGVVPEAAAVEIAGAVRVVLLATMERVKKGAREKGGISQDVCVVTLVQVLEVWSSKSVKLWAAPNSLLGAVEGRTMEPSGKLS